MFVQEAILMIVGAVLFIATGIIAIINYDVKQKKTQYLKNL